MDEEFYDFSGGILDQPAIETKFAPYGSSLEMDCRLDLDPPIQFQWNKLGGRLPPDSQTHEVHKMHTYHLFLSNQERSRILVIIIYFNKIPTHAIRQLDIQYIYLILFFIFYRYFLFCRTN